MVGDSLVDQVRQSTDIVEVISEYVTLEEQGRRMVALCPFHEERTPSFSVSPERQLYYCFGCHAGGDVFNFIMDIEGVAFQQALQMLAERAGLDYSEGDVSGEKVSREQRMRHYLYRLGEFAARFFIQRLGSDEGSRALKYLEDRGIPEDVRNEYRLGYAPDSWNALCRLLQQRGVNMKAAEVMGLVKRSEEKGNYYDAFRDRVMFPISDFRGRVVGFGGRVLGDSHPKYLNSPENPVFIKGSVWYGLDRARDEIRRRSRAVLVEGYMDVLACVTHGWRETVACMGTAVTQKQVRLLRRYAREAFLAYDADSAGTEAVLRSGKSFAATGVTLRVVALPEGTDPDDVLSGPGGEETFRTCMDEARTLFEFCWERACSNHDITTAEGKARAVGEVAGLISAEEDSVIRAERMRSVAADLNLPERAVYEQVRRLQQMETRHKRSINRHNTKENYGTNRPEHRSAAYRAERQVLQLMLQECEFMRRGVDLLTGEDFEYEGHRKVVEWIFERGAGIEVVDGEHDVLGGCEDPNVRKLVAGMLMEDLPAQAVERVFSDCVGVMRRRRKQKRIEELRGIINEKERKGERVPPDVLQEQMRLLVELKARRDVTARE